MPGELLSHGDGPANARCKHCGTLAVGPCARCRSPVCGDCCVLTTGGTHPWAICLGCDRTGGRSLGAGWRMVLGWLLLPMFALFLAVLALYVLFADRLAH